MSEKVSVLLAVEQLRRRVPGGIGTYARGLVGGLARCTVEGDPVDVTLLASRPPWGQRHEDPLARLGPPVRTSDLPGKLLTRAWDHGLVHAPEGFDVVHSVALSAPPLRRDSRSRLVVTVHDVAWRRHPGATTRRGRRWHEAALARVAGGDVALVTPSRFVAADLEASGIARDRITVVWSGADHLPAPDGRATDLLLHTLGVSGHYLLTVSTLEPRKNLVRLVRAYAVLRPSLPEPWPLIIVGPTGWGHGIRSVGGTRQRAGWPGDLDTEGVIVAGEVSAPVLVELYRRARAFAYVPLTEGYGMPPLEAMWNGTPTVVSDQVPSVHDLDTAAPPPARVVDPLDVAAIASGLADVLLDETRRADLASRGTAYARARTWHAAARQHLALWRSLS